MKLNRRNAIIGLGSAAVGTGALLGTGAFTTVEAQRNVQINTEGDNDALVQLYPTEKGADFLADFDSDEAVIDLENGIENSDEVPGNGLNENGVTVIDDLFHIVNAGTQEVNVSIHDALTDLSGSETFADLADDPDHGVGFFEEGKEDAARGGAGVDGIEVESHPDPSSLPDDLSEYEDLDDISVRVGIVVDTGGLADHPAGEFDGGEVDVTIVANATDD